jgi:hypothetical protein
VSTKATAGAVCLDAHTRSRPSGERGPLRCWTPPVPDDLLRSLIEDGDLEDSDDVEVGDVNKGDVKKCDHGGSDYEGFDTDDPTAEKDHAEEDQAKDSYSDLFHFDDFSYGGSDNIESDKAKDILVEDIFKPIAPPGTNDHVALKRGVEHPHASVKAKQAFQPNRPDSMVDCMSQLSHQFTHLSVRRPSSTHALPIMSGQQPSSTTSLGDAGMHASHSLASSALPLDPQSPGWEHLDAEAFKLDIDPLLCDLKTDHLSKGCTDSRVPLRETAVSVGFDGSASSTTDSEMPEREIVGRVVPVADSGGTWANFTVLDKAAKAGECYVLAKGGEASGLRPVTETRESDADATCDAMYGFGPLHRAILMNDLAAVNRLLEDGANPGSSCKDGLKLGFPNEVPESATPTYQYVRSPTALHLAAFVGNEKIVAALLAWGATERKLRGRPTAAKLASRLQRKPIVVILLENHWWHKDAYIEWLVLYAARQGHLSNVTACCTMLEADTESGKLLFLWDTVAHNASALPGAALPSSVSDLLLVADKHAYLSGAPLQPLCSGLLRRQ